MHGLIGKMTATPGQRDTLQSILLESIKDMPGCLSYVIAQDATNADAVWITEVWDSEASHGAVAASMSGRRRDIPGQRLAKTPIGRRTASA